MGDQKWNLLYFDDKELPSKNYSDFWIYVQNPTKHSRGSTGKWMIRKNNVRLSSEVSKDTLKNFKLSKDSNASWKCLGCGRSHSLMNAFCTHCYTPWKHPDIKFTALDKVWMQTFVHARNGTMNCISAKSSTKKQDENNGVVCIYTKDIFDAADILKTAQDIRDKLKVQVDIKYKSDIQTMLGIYSGPEPEIINFNQYGEFWGEKQRELKCETSDDIFGLKKIPSTMYCHSIYKENEFEMLLNEKQIAYFKRIAKEYEEYLRDSTKD